MGRREGMKADVRERTDGDECFAEGASKHWAFLSGLYPDRTFVIEPTRETSDGCQCYRIVEK